MEKKVPERKVSLREEDIFYVYDKRINKCIKEECEGTVKYGLVLRVNMSDEETCNCFECNKCHMKYTPYPNYVRLTKTDMLEIYNKEEVDARDRKRAEDAAKQAARERRKQQQGRRFTPRRDAEQGTEHKYHSYEKKPYGRNAYGNGSYDRKPYDRKLYGRFSNDNNSYERKPYDKEGYEKKTYERKSFGRKTYDSRGYEGKPFEKKSYDSGRNYHTEAANGERRKSNIVITNGNYKKPYSNNRRNQGSYQNRYEKDFANKEIQ